MRTLVYRLGFLHVKVVLNQVHFWEKSPFNKYFDGINRIDRIKLIEIYITS